ncbi:MAG: response regulator [Eubacterium sp.]|nr:response regulator [Eubacterium sp.]
MHKRSRKTDVIIILAMVLIFAVIIVTNARLILRTMTQQTERIGRTEISGIRSDFEGYIGSAENELIKVSSGAEQILDSNDDRTGLEEYIIEQKKAQIDASKGVNFNVYIAGQGWEIIPDFDAPADYHATERNWYVGAIESAGEIYITEPYIDSMTGEMCFTLSLMLADKETVVAMDFTLSEIQESIEKMSLSDGSKAMITTADGLIVGYTDMTYVGKNISKALPEYQTVLQEVLERTSEDSFKLSIDGKRNTVFHAATMNNWYMILCVNDSALYKSTTRQVILNVVVNIFMLIIIVVLYIIGIRNRIRSEEALRSREHFVNKIIENLKEPLDNIINISNKGGLDDNSDRESFAEIKASSLRMNEMMKDLKAYSSMVTDMEYKEKSRRISSRNLSKSIRIFRNVIVILLVIFMAVSSYLFYNSSHAEVDDLMTMGRNYYGYQLRQWDKEQMTILSMFTDAITAQPEILDDYDKAVKWLDSIAKHYSSISVCYIANPYKEHTVIMNNGWQPEADWKVEEREWYRETEKSVEGRSISAPYYDEQTGYYCITISKMVYGENGEFLGIFGIDLYMDKIVDIFGETYSEDEYVFLVDPNGDIINHPNDEYQMSSDIKVNIKDTPYYEAYKGKTSEMYTFRDYDGVRRCCKYIVDNDTGFSIFIVWDWKQVYLYQIIYTAFYAVFVLVMIIVIIVLINKVIKSQTLMNNKLSEAVQEATIAGKAKTDFLAQMSHEIRTPINAVIGMDEMILRETDDPAIREYASDIKSASKTLLTLINGVLDFSKIESGKMEIVPVKYDTAEMIDSLVNMISDRADKKGLTLNLDIDEKLPKTLFGDDMRIRQVITNLLTNAVKYTDQGSVSFTMRGEDITEEECTLFVEVKDTGIGIKEEDMEKLFESFRRIEERRNRTIEGTGLGMSIVDGILKLMGSSLVVESKYGQGSSFSFRIIQKIIDKDTLGQYQRHRDEKVVDKDKNELKIIKADVLVVDDNVMNLKVAKGLMKKFGLVPDLAGSGREAMEQVKKKRYDIILMDHMMPGMDGIETLKAIRNDALIGDDTVVIALTANAISGAREMYISEGFRDYLSKPINPTELEEMLEKYLPEDRIERWNMSDGRNLKEEEEPVLAELREKGFNIDAALGYAMDDKELYQELLTTFVQSYDDRLPDIKKAHDEAEWKDYKTYVHALKSSSKTIGADTLSDMALKQELAAIEQDTAVIEEGYAAVLDEYKKVVEAIREVLHLSENTADTTETAETSADEPVILEFYPEDEE